MTLTLFKQTTEMGEVRKENRELELKLATIRRSIDAEVTRERDYVEEIAELTQENKGLQKKCKQDGRDMVRPLCANKPQSDVVYN